MNKVFNINLGGYPFTIDEDAYEHLHSYLKTIHQHFRPSEGYSEITGDIESRLAELFREGSQGRLIVTFQDVEDAITIMGTPEEFGADPLRETETSHDAFADPTDADTTQDQQRKRTSGYRTGRRLFRNTDDEMVAGVASGLAAYFGIEDPTWVRAAFAIAFVLGGMAIPIYIILWVVMPEAKTASDRLAMKGEPITASNIGKIIEEEMTYFSEKMEDFGQEFSEKFESGMKGSQKKKYGKRHRR